MNCGAKKWLKEKKLAARKDTKSYKNYLIFVLSGLPEDYNTAVFPRSP